ncbi:MAG: carboxymuconolactone decarboxylase family protein, partial [Pseudohongiellaceae bacterium]
MGRLHTITPAQATGRTGELYAAITKTVGKVPNIYQGLGNSAIALEGVLHADGLLKQGQLSGGEIEAIKLAVSEEYGCQYCLAAHTLLGKHGGLSDAEIIGSRRGEVGTPRLDTLVKFVKAVLQPQAR